MSDTPSESVQSTLDLDSLSAELRQVITFEQVPAQLYEMVASIHEATEEVIRDAWSTLPASAQNVLDNFEQFHALLSVSQSFAAVNVLQDFPSLDLPSSMSDEDKESYKQQLLQTTMQSCVKDMLKQIKKARRDPILKRDFTTVFSHE